MPSLAGLYPECRQGGSLTAHWLQDSESRMAGASIWVFHPHFYSHLLFCLIPFLQSFSSSSPQIFAYCVSFFNPRAAKTVVPQQDFYNTSSCTLHPMCSVEPRSLSPLSQEESSILGSVPKVLLDLTLCSVIIVQSLRKGVHVFAIQISSEPLCRSQRAEAEGLSNRVTFERLLSSSLSTKDKGPGRVTHCNVHKWTHTISISKNVHITQQLKGDHWKTEESKQ